MYKLNTLTSLLAFNYLFATYNANVVQFEHIIHKDTQNDKLDEISALVQSMSPEERVLRATVCTAITAGAIYTGSELILSASGFGRKGPLKGSAAAKVQSMLDRYGISNKVKSATFGQLQRMGMVGTLGTIVTVTNVGRIAALCGLDPVEIKQLYTRSVKHFESICGQDGEKCIDKANELYETALDETEELIKDVIGAENVDKIKDKSTEIVDKAQAVQQKVEESISKSVDDFIQSDMVQNSWEKGSNQAKSMVEKIKNCIKSGKECIPFLKSTGSGATGFASASMMLSALMMLVRIQ